MNDTILVKEVIGVRIALITTTIYVPEVLALYRDCNKDVFIYVTGDEKTPHQETRRFIEGLGNAAYYDVEDQKKLEYASSEVIGWNKIMRRNIALLEALKHKADLIITIDDDNIPLNRNYFDDFVDILTKPFSGLQIFSDANWFNAGELLAPKVFHRGFPVNMRDRDLSYRCVPACNVKIGVAAGLWLGDPDVDAITGMTSNHRIHQISEVARNGVVVSNSLFTPFNSQNTAYLSELAPLMMVLVGVGRYDDIWASYIAERIMMETDLHVHFGGPFVWQERNPQSRLTNLKDEIFGMQFTDQFCRDLTGLDLGTGTILEKMRRLYDGLKSKAYLPPIIHDMGAAWCQDIESVL